MRILIVTTFFPPSNSIASHRPYSWAKYWTEMGHDVTVITPKIRATSITSLNFENNGFKILTVHEQKFLEYLKKSYRKPDSSNQQTSSSRPSLKGLLKQRLSSSFETFRQKTGVLNALRMPDVSDYWIKNAKQLLQQYGHSWDLVISSFGPYSSHLIARHLKRKGLAKKWIADFRDLWVDHHFFKGIFPFTKIEKSLERSIANECDAITVVSQGMANIFTKKYPSTMVKVIENGFEPADNSKINPKPIFPNDRKIRIVYTGLIYPGKRDPTPLFEAINNIAKEENKQLLSRLEVLFCGPNTHTLNKLITKYQLSPWVSNLGMQPREDALRMQRDASFLLFLEWNNPSASYMLTGKLFEYLQSQKPILGIGVRDASEPGQLIKKANAGVIFSEDISAIQSFLIKKLKQSSPPSFNSKKELISQYTREKLANKMLLLALELLPSEQQHEKIEV